MTSTEITCYSKTPLIGSPFTFDVVPENQGEASQSTVFQAEMPQGSNLGTILSSIVIISELK